MIQCVVRLTGEAAKEAGRSLTVDHPEKIAKKFVRRWELVHRAVGAELANARTGQRAAHSPGAEVRWRCPQALQQKGTGRARQGFHPHTTLSRPVVATLVHRVNRRFGMARGAYRKTVMIPSDIEDMINRSDRSSRRWRW